MTRVFVAAVLGCVVGMGHAHVSHAQDDAAAKTKAKALYAKATDAYNIGQWQRAIELFQEAYGAHPFKNILFDLGQANRHAGNCRQALFFYKRFLVVKPDTSNRAEVEGFIEQCDAVLSGRPVDKPIDKPVDRPVDKPADQPADKPADNPADKPADRPADKPVADPASDKPIRVADATDTGNSATDTTVSATAPSASEAPSLIVAAVQAGPAFVRLLKSDEVPTQFTFNVSAAYPIAVGPMTVEAGGWLGYTRVGWVSMTTGATGNLGLITLTAGGAASYPVMDKLSIRGELGIGVLVMTGLDDPNSVFIGDIEFDSSAASALHGRIALGAEYAVTPNLLVTAHPVTFWQAQKIDGLSRDMGPMRQFSPMVGVSYRR